tara:strand:- start:650 stop:1600 length:951 start_codon:yes stop_codon:yes gene_type:complete
MAVYTSIDVQTLNNFLKKYNIGELLGYEGILEGVENTNYKITTIKNKFILTIFEKRVNEEELPFFIELQHHLSKKNIKCPRPIADKKNNYVNVMKEKKCVIMSYLEGEKLHDVKPKHCLQLGEEIANMHLCTSDFTLSRKNNLDQSNWKSIFRKCQSAENHKYYQFYTLIENELIFIEKNWPKNLPSGVIHADIFQDNVFYIKEKLTGLIDFYFACNDYYAYDLAICINAWCFNNNGDFDSEKFNSIISGYNNLRKLNEEEYKYIRILMRGAAVRFLLTRLHDELYHPKNAFVEPKDPIEYLNILKFHQYNEVIND